MGFPTPQGGAGAGFGSLWDFIHSFRQEARYNDFQQNQVDPLNRRGLNLLDWAGAQQGQGPIGYSDTQGQRDVNFADQNFGDNATLGAFERFNAPARTGLTNLPGQVAGQTGGYLNQFGNAARGINAGYNDLLSNARGIVGGISNQETRDVNRRFDQQGAAETMRLNSQGLGASTANSVRGGIERDRSDELRRVADQTARERLGVESQFGLTGLGAQTQLASTGLQGGLSAAGLNASTGLNAYGQLGGMGQSEFDALMASRGLRFNARTGRTERGTDTRQNVFGTAAQYYGGPTLIAPS